ncbi:hypothetical protein MTO96_007071 [Rhipicephalus appendiculatus]
MLPLSQYIQGGLTSMVTVGRPANSLDTLEELEAALDAGAIAPCVQMETASFNILVNSYHSTTLEKKLQESFFEHSDQLLKDSMHSCLDCATKTDGVCYTPRMASPILKEYLVNVIPFDEDFVTRPSSLPIRKTFPLKDALQGLPAEGVRRRLALFTPVQRRNNLPSVLQARGRLLRRRRHCSSYTTSSHSTPCCSLVR